ncbi:hypothetical protein, partial [Roseofilum casamattae]
MSSISIIGTRTCGKTTYLAALARFPHQDKYPGLEVNPIGSDAEELIDMADSIIRQGQAIPGNPREESRRDYEFDIKIPKLTESIRLLVKDSAGELFDDLPLKREQWPSDLRDFVEELCQATGWIVITDWIKGADTRIYKPALQNLLKELNFKETNNKDMLRKRIAVVMSKCERGEAWTGRLDPGEDLFRLRMPATYKELQLSKHLPQRIGF